MEKIFEKYVPLLNIEIFFSALINFINIDDCYESMSKCSSWSDNLR